MKILIGYDGSEDSDGALQDLELAGLPHRAEVLVLSESAPWVSLDSDQGPLLGGRVPYPETPEESRRQAARVAAKGATRLRKLFPRWKVKSQGGDLNPAIGILEVAKQWQPDLIVLGSHGKGALTRLFLGSVSLKVLHHATADVRITRLRARTALGPPRILIGMDGSRGAQGAVLAMAERSWPEGSKARIIAVLPDSLDPIAAPGTRIRRRTLSKEQRDLLDRPLAMAAGHLAAAGLDVEVVFREGDARVSILKEAKSWKADTICLGCRGMGALGRFLIGSISSTVAVNAPCTVEVVRNHRKIPGDKV